MTRLTLAFLVLPVLLAGCTKWLTLPTWQGG